MPNQQQVPGTNPPSVDPTTLNLARAIRQVESGDNPNAKGKSGEFGVGQWMPGNFETAASKYGLDPNDRSQTNQEHVLYNQIDEQLKAGHSQSEVASWWNSGKYDPTGNVGVNKEGVAYDTPAYVQKVKNAYMSASQQGSSQTSGYQTTPALSAPTGVPENTDKGFLGNVASDITNRTGQAAQAISQTAQGKINPLSGVLQTAGAAAGGIGDIVGETAGLIPGVKQAEGAIGGAIGNIPAIQNAAKQYGQFSQAHPELAGDISAVGNIATLLPIGKVAGVAKEAIGKGIGAAIGKEALAGTIADVTPNLGAKGLAKEITKQGIIKTPLGGKIVRAVSPSSKKLAETVVDNVPNFTKLGTFAEKVTATQDAVDNLATQLKTAVESSGKNRIYPFKELSAQLNGVEKPLMIASDNTLNNAYDRVIAKALDIAKQKGGTISSLFDARKEFDGFIAQQFPNLYASDTLTPMRSAVRGIRGAMNDFIEEHLPEGSGFKESLKTQSRLLDAIENMAPKAVKEIGSTGVDRLLKRHPIATGLVKKGAGLFAAGLGLGEAQNLLGK